MLEPETIPVQMNKKKGELLFYQMLLIRRFEEKAAEQYSKGKIRGFLHLYIGEEAVAVGVTQALSKEVPIANTVTPWLGALMPM